MAFSNFVPPFLNREQSGAMPDIISHLLGGYSKGMHAAYLPQQIEADIFSKKISPLATLATSPMFLQNPQFQQALGNLLSRNLGGMGQGFEGLGGNNETFAGQIGRDINEAENYANELTKGGKVQSSLSGVGGQLENQLGEVGKHIAEFFGLSPNLANKENQFNDTLKRLKKTAIDTQLLSPRDAEDIFTQRKNETAKQALTRIKKRAPSLFQQGESPNQGQMAIEDQRESDNRLYKQAIDVTEQVKNKTGIDLDEMKVFDYIKKHPGKIHFPSLKKYALG